MRRAVVLPRVTTNACSDFRAHSVKDVFDVQLGPELYRQTGTFVDTESEIRAKRLPDCLPIGGSQIDPAFLKRIFDFETRSPRVGQITSIEAAGRSDRASDLAYGQTVRNHLLSV